jgi:hypothetical protein
VQHSAAKPSGSFIHERDEWDGSRFVWHLPSANPQRFSVVLFLAFWLCGWAFGWISAARKLASGGPHLFLIGWLGAWTIGGIAAIWMLWGLLRPTRPESITLRQSDLVYDPGRSPSNELLRNNWGYRSNRELGRALTNRRKRSIAVAKSDLGTFVLDRVGERQRLYFDLGAERIEIGSCLGEPDREWLYATLERWRLA